MRAFAWAQSDLAYPAIAKRQRPDVGPTDVKDRNRCSAVMSCTAKPNSLVTTGLDYSLAIATQYRAPLRSPVLRSAPLFTKSARSRVTVAGGAPVMLA
jgi:hypothetical protein